MPAAIIVLFALVIGAGLYVSWYLKKKRRLGVAALAQRLGLEYSADDPFGLDERLPHHLFTLGDGRGCENAMWGTWSGLPVCEFDYWYYTESSDSNGGRSKNYHRFSCVVLPVALRCADLIVTGENFFTRIADGIGFHDIQFETEEFNRAWTVKCPDPKFANDVIDQRMMAWLMHTGTSWSFELAGTTALIYSKKLSPSQIHGLLACAKQFSERIPRVAYDLYPAVPAGYPWPS